MWRPPPPTPSAGTTPAAGRAAACVILETSDQGVILDSGEPQCKAGLHDCVVCLGPVSACTDKQTKPHFVASRWRRSGKRAHNGVEAALVVAGDARHRRQRCHSQRHRLQRTEIADIGLRPQWARWRKCAAVGSQQFHDFAVAMLLFRRLATAMEQTHM